MVAILFLLDEVVYRQKGTKRVHGIVADLERLGTRGRQSIAAGTRISALIKIETKWPLLLSILGRLRKLLLPLIKLNSTLIFLGLNNFGKLRIDTFGCAKIEPLHSKNDLWLERCC
jgi:hypothetical protein